MNTGAAPPPQSLSRRRGLSCLPPRAPSLPDAPSPPPAFSRSRLPQAVSTEEKESYRMSAIQNLHSFGKPGEGRGPEWGWRGRSSASPLLARAGGVVVPVGQICVQGRPPRVPGRNGWEMSPRAGPGVSGGAFTNGSCLSASHTRPLPPPLRHVLYVTVVVTEQGGQAPPREPGFRSVASAGWGSACPLGPLHHVISCRGRAGLEQKAHTRSSSCTDLFPEGQLRTPLDFSADISTAKKEKKIRRGESTNGIQHFLTKIISSQTPLLMQVRVMTCFLLALRIISI